MRVSKIVYLGFITHLKAYIQREQLLRCFITLIKASKLGENTLIAATSDHQMRWVKAHLPEGSILEKAVPFDLYVPGAILEQVEH